METDNNKEILESLPVTTSIPLPDENAILPDETDDFLEILTKKKSKKKTIRNIIVLVLCIAIVGTAITLSINHFVDSSSQTETVYRESVISKGDITVGMTESSSISLTKNEITLPITAEIEEIYVKSGQMVKEGDPLFKYSSDDAQDYLDDYALEVQTASIALQNAQADQKTKLLSAKQNLEISQLESEQASESKELTLEQLKLSLSNAQSDFENAEEKLNSLDDLSDDIVNDIETLSDYYSNMIYYEELVSDSKDDVSNYQSDSSNTSEQIKALENIINSLESYGITSNSSESVNNTIINNYLTTMNTAKTTLDTEVSNNTDPVAIENAQKAYDKAKNNYDNITSLYVNYETYQNNCSYLDELNLYDAMYTSLSQNSSDDANTYTEKYEEAKEKYNDFNEDFKEKYGNSSTEDEVIDQYISSQASYTKAQLDVQQQEMDNELSTLKANQKYDSVVLEGQLAQQTYNITSLTLNQNVAKAQEDYDEITEEYEELKNLLSDDGIVRATEQGMISSISISEGDIVEIKASNSQTTTTYPTIMTVTSIKDVYVPISITEDDILDVYVGQPASVVLSAYPNEKFDAIVDSISIESARVGAATVTYTVNVKFTEENTLTMYEGMTADVTLIKASVEDVIYVQSQAVTKENEFSYVYVKDENGEPIKTQVITGFTDGKNIEIKSGIDIDDVIMTQSAVGSSSVTNMSSDFSSKFPSGASSDFANRKE